MSYFDSFTPVVLINEQVLQNFPHDKFKDNDLQTTKFQMWLSEEEKLLPLFSIGINIKDITKLSVLCKVESVLNEDKDVILTHYLCTDKTVASSDNNFNFFMIVKRKIKESITFDIVYVNKDEDVNVQEYKLKSILFMLRLFEKEWGTANGKVE